MQARKKTVILAAALSLQSFFSGYGKVKARVSSTNDGFRGWPGNARARGKAKRKERLRALKASADLKGKK